MPKFEFCLPTAGKAAPAGPDWLHEIKYDGYRLRIERDGSTVRLVTRGGYDWTRRFPWIAEAAKFVIDGEAVALSVNGISGRRGPPGSPVVDAQSQLERLLRGRCGELIPISMAPGSVAMPGMMAR